mgnify:CR=1 FL=1
MILMLTCWRISPTNMVNTSGASNARSARTNISRMPWWVSLTASSSPSSPGLSLPVLLPAAYRHKQNVCVRMRML